MSKSYKTHLNTYHPPLNYQAKIHNGPRLSAQRQRHHESYKFDVEDDNEYAYHNGDPIWVHIDVRETIPSTEIRTLQNQLRIPSKSIPI
jgi:hypothetical protein